jgi:hypothetical protein
MESYLALSQEQEVKEQEQERHEQQQELEEEDEAWMRGVMSSDESLLTLDEGRTEEENEMMTWNEEGYGAWDDGDENNSSFSEDFISWSEDIRPSDDDDDHDLVEGSSSEDEDDGTGDNLTEPCNERLVKEGLPTPQIQNKLDLLQEKLLLSTTDYYFWESIYSKNGLEVTKKSFGIHHSHSRGSESGRDSGADPITASVTATTMIRGQIFLPYSIFEIMSILIDPRFRKELEPSISKCPVPQWISHHTAIEYLLYHPVWPTTPRDACNLVHWRLLKNGLFLYYATSEPSSLYPEKEGVVRSHLTLGGYVMRHVPGGTLLFLLVEVHSSF